MLDARPSVLWLALLLLACTSDAPERDMVELSGGTEPSSVGDPGQHPADSSTADAAPCAALVESAKVLLESHTTCQVDADCRDEAILAPCPAPPQCSVYVRKDTDVLWSAATKLELDYLHGCGRCAAVKCSARETTRAYCDPTKHCAGRKQPASSMADAAAPEPRSDAGARPVTTDASSAAADASLANDAGSGASPYACKANLDCVITNVGNCCGYYPRCANVNATFAPPACTGGQTGVCGFPTIDSCECRQNSCVSLQAGSPI
jgi:hypothetical protein